MKFIALIQRGDHGSISVVPLKETTPGMAEHEADLKAIFFDLTGADDASIAGWYVDKRKALAVDKALETAMTQLPQALRELKHQQIPDGHIELIRARLVSSSFAHRVAGLCAAVYLTALLLSDAQK